MLQLQYLSLPLHCLSFLTPSVYFISILYTFSYSPHILYAISSTSITPLPFLLLPDVLKLMFTLPFFLPPTSCSYLRLCKEKLDLRPAATAAAPSSPMAFNLRLHHIIEMETHTYICIDAKSGYEPHAYKLSLHVPGLTQVHTNTIHSYLSVCRVWLTVSASPRATPPPAPIPFLFRLQLKTHTQ